MRVPTPEGGSAAPGASYTAAAGFEAGCPEARTPAPDAAAGESAYNGVDIRSLPLDSQHERENPHGPAVAGFFVPAA